MDLYETLFSRLNAPLKHLTIGEHSFPMTTWVSPRVHLSPWLVYQGLDGVFRSAPKLTSLYLCPGVFMDPLVLEHLESGELLPLLEKLGVSSVSGWDIVWMVKGRNLASTRPESSNLLVAPMAPPVALNYLELFVMGWAKAVNRSFRMLWEHSVCVQICRYLLARVRCITSVLFFCYSFRLLDFLFVS